MTKTVFAWHFSSADCKLGNGDGRAIKVGKTLEVDCEPILCRQGLHASVKIIDALKYAPGPYLWRVKLGGTIVTGDDKLVATERTHLWGFDATDMLRKFARLCALDVVHLWDCPDVVKRFLETGDESLRAAAWDATVDAAWAAADSAWAAADAAWTAARASAGAAADAARDAQQKRLASMVTKAVAKGE